MQLLGRAKKVFPRANTLAYFHRVHLTKKTSFLTLTPVANATNS